MTVINVEFENVEFNEELNANDVQSLVYVNDSKFFNEDAFNADLDLTNDELVIYDEFDRIELERDLELSKYQSIEFKTKLKKEIKRALSQNINEFSFNYVY